MTTAPRQTRTKSLHTLWVFLCMLVLAMPFTLRFSGADDGVEIAREGRSAYRIVIADDAPHPTVYAAIELRNAIGRMTGAVLPVVTDDMPPAGHEILVGGSSRLFMLDIHPAPDTAGLGREGYLLRTAGPHLIILGGEPRGTLYGVYGLLSDHFGCRWFTPDVTFMPRMDRLSLGALDERGVPPLEYRECYEWDAFDGDWAARNRLNRNSRNGTLGPRHGGRIEWVDGYFAHTFAKLVPPSEYSRSHPEYFSLVNGHRQRTRTQLCCTNEDVIAIVTDEVLRLFRENPDADVLSISQNDWDNHCECSHCQALADREGTQMAPVLHLVNRVADAVDAEFPGKVVETLAYQWTRKPPRTMRPRHNVAVRLCTIECCFSHPLDVCDSEENRLFIEDLRGWSRQCDRLWIWNYVTSFAHYLVPFPDLLGRGRTMRLFVDNHVTAVFQQGVYNTPGGELSALSAWLNARILWDPECDVDAAVDEFLFGVYGPAADPVRQYIDLIHDTARRLNVHAGIWHGPDAGYLTDAVLDTADSLWSAAEDAVRGMPEVLGRVRTARLSVDYAILYRDLNRGDALLVDERSMTLERNPAWTARLDRFRGNAHDAGMLRLKEYTQTVDEFVEAMNAAAAPRDIPRASPVSVTSLEPGLVRRAYKGRWFSMPRFESLKHLHNDRVGGFELPEAAFADSCGCTFTGYIDIPADGIYSFRARSGRGSRLTIGGIVVVDNRGSRQSVHERAGHIVLEKGLYALELGWFTNGGTPMLDIEWEGPGIGRSPVPAGVLYRKAR